MRKLTLPHDVDVLGTLPAGEEILLSGEVLTMRDAGLRRLSELVEKGEEPPFELKGQVIFHAGPSPAAAGRPCGSVGPTTSARMDVFLPMLFDLGARSTIGKGPRGTDTGELHARHGTSYLVAVGGVGALLGGMVEEVEPLAWEDLGPEAVYRVRLKDFPVLIAIDAGGKDHLGEQHLLYRRGKE